MSPRSRSRSGSAPPLPTTIHSSTSTAEVASCHRRLGPLRACPHSSWRCPTPRRECTRRSLRRGPKWIRCTTIPSASTSARRALEVSILRAAPFTERIADDHVTAFACAYNLKMHIQTHDPNRRLKPYSCHHKSCGRSFSRKHDLTRHMVSIHRAESVTAMLALSGGSPHSIGDVVPPSSSPVRSE